MGCRSPSPEQSRRIACNVSQPGVGAGVSRQPCVCANTLDTKRHQRSSGAATPPGREQNTAHRLILMVGWRDSFAARMRRNGRGSKRCRGLTRKHYGGWRRHVLLCTLDTGRLMGAPFHLFTIHQEATRLAYPRHRTRPGWAGMRSWPTAAPYLPSGSFGRPRHAEKHSRSGGG